MKIISGLTIFINRISHTAFELVCECSKVVQYLLFDDIWKDEHCYYFG